MKRSQASLIWALLSLAFLTGLFGRITICLTESLGNRKIRGLIYAGIAQLVEHNLAKVGVASSSLVSRSITHCFDWLWKRTKIFSRLSVGNQFSSIYLRISACINAQIFSFSECTRKSTLRRIRSLFRQFISLIPQNLESSGVDHLCA